MYTTLIATTAGLSGALIGSGLTVWSGTKFAHAVADFLRARNEHEVREVDDSGWWIDEQDRDAIRQLMTTASIVYNAVAVGFAVAPNARKALDDALEESEARFSDLFKEPASQD